MSEEELVRREPEPEVEQRPGASPAPGPSLEALLGPRAARPAPPEAPPAAAPPELAPPLPEPVRVERPRTREDRALEHSLAPGEVAEPPREPLADYEELEVIGTGGAGVVTRARERASGEWVAIKRLRKPFDRARFLQEADAIASLDHPGIVRLRRVIGGADPEEPLALVLELVDGPDLEALARREGKLRLEQAIELGLQVAAALGHAHARGLIHRDVKPSNVLLDGAGRAHLTDFGLALAVEAQLSMTPSGAALGTPSYMAPEQLEGAHGVDARADVYGLGATLYRLVTGRSPRVIRERYLPAALSELVLRCVEESPQDRYPDMAALARDLERAAERVRRDASGVHAPLERAVQRVQRELETSEQRQAGRRLLAAVVGLANLELLPGGAPTRLRSRLELGEPWTDLLEDVVAEVLAEAPRLGDQRARLLRDAHAILSAALSPHPPARGVLKRLAEKAREIVRDPPGVRLGRVVELLVREEALAPEDLRVLSSRSGPARVVLEAVLTRLRLRAEEGPDRLRAAQRARRALRELSLVLPEWAVRLEEEDLALALREAAERARQEREARAAREAQAAAEAEAAGDEGPPEA